MGYIVDIVADSCKKSLGAAVVDATEHLTIDRANKNLKDKRFWFFLGHAVGVNNLFSGIEVNVPLLGNGDVYDDKAMAAGLSVDMALIMACSSAQDGGKGEAMKKKLGAKVWVGLTVDMLDGRAADIGKAWMAASDGQKKVFEVKAAVVVDKELAKWIDVKDIGIIGDENYVLDTTP